MKKVLIVSTSPRMNSNSEALAKAFAKGAQEAGHEAELISLRGKTVNFCRGGFVCQEKQRCVIRDDADEICQKALHADVLVFATPIYYYEMSGQLKTLLDRLNPLFPSDYAFRDVYFLSAAAEAEEEVPQRAVSGLEGWIDCFGRAKLAGTVFMGGVTAAGENPAHPALEQAYQMGKKV
jgi:multimeric flavodoxin WrbA